MTTELRTQNRSQRQWLQALSSAWRNGVQLYDPSIWQTRDSEVEEKMLRDADIQHAVGYRRSTIAGNQWSLVAESEASPRAMMAIAVGTQLLRKIKKFTEARFGLARAFFSGSRFARIHGEHQVLTIGDGRPRTWWVPTRLEDLDKRMFRIVPSHEDRTAHWERWDVWEAKFVAESPEDAMQTIRHVYQDDQASLGHGRALREALGWWWYAKTNVFQESLQAVERFAQGIITAKVDGVRNAETGLPNRELIRQWQEVLEDLRARHVLVYDASDQVETLAPSGEGWQLLEGMRKELRSAIFTLINGANLTTSADGGGSFALAEVQQDSTEVLARFDRESLEDTLSDDLLGCLWWKNHINLLELDIHDEKPRFSITQEKRQDPKERADVAAVLNGMGVDLSADELYEQTGFTRPQEGEDVIGGAEPPADPLGGLGGFGGFGGMPGMGDPMQGAGSGIPGMPEPMQQEVPQQPPQQAPQQGQSMRDGIGGLDLRT